MKNNQAEIARNFFMESARKLLEQSFPFYVKQELAHYTTPEGFEGIIKTRKFWMTDYARLVDQDEIKYAKEAIEQSAENWVSKQRDFRGGFIPYLWSLFDRTHQHSEFRVFTTSFCEELDDKDMFEDFAKNGRGVALVFDSSYFTPNGQLPSDGEYVVTTNMCYDISKIDSYLKGIFLLGDKLKNKVPFGKSLKKQKEVLFDVLAVKLITFMIVIKEKSLKKEREHRLWRCQGKHHDQCFPDSQKPLIVHSRKNGSDYIYSREFEPNNLKEIKMGPYCLLTEEKIHEILTENGFDISKVKITQSKFTPK